MTRCVMFIVVLIVGCGDRERTDTPPHASSDSAGTQAAAAAHRDSVRADSGRPRDTAALREAALPEDPPCFASHFGLPCQ
jgi:hypothetical protein